MRNLIYLFDEIQTRVSTSASFDTFSGKKEKKTLLFTFSTINNGHNVKNLAFQFFFIILQNLR